MVGNFRLASDKQLAALHEAPQTVQAFLFGADDEPTIAHHANHDLDIGKSWDGLAFLLAPLRFIREGGREIGDVDVGHGRVARSFTAAEVAVLARETAALDESKLRARFKPAQMTALYPPGAWDGAFDGLFAEFQRLQQFLAGAEKRKLGLIVYLT